MENPMPKAKTTTTAPATELQLPDTAILQGCDAIMKAYNKNWNRMKGGYDGLVRTIESHANAVAPIPATSDAGLKAKAGVVQQLAKVGCAMYAVRILAQSLAADVLAEGAA